MNNILFTKKEVKHAIFKDNAPIYTRVRDEVPAFFGQNASMSNAAVSDGCSINGTIIDSVISRHVVVEDKVVIKNSLIMGNCRICKGAYIENAIIDKDITIKPGEKLIGTKNSPVIIMKGNE